MDPYALIDWVAWSSVKMNKMFGCFAAGNESALRSRQSTVILKCLIIAGEFRRRPNSKSFFNCPGLGSAPEGRYFPGKCLKLAGSVRSPHKIV